MLEMQDGFMRVQMMTLFKQWSGREHPGEYKNETLQSNIIGQLHLWPAALVTEYLVELIRRRSNAYE